ncbi:TRAP transporter substrate-binding protein [Roseomonas sp. M0104]|uniref:TRAP transporter substrate-binding protein n=1 Tax=Teichococcus coralli TaxID=2545983 RepID=A0A845BDZ6_9PROT|nr:TRAP transporter substrate-binding protein [Pseudoroseomonas coralli]MXP63512.1 TRAP transporter substrate-binding protein [Pseudoroseomonas coralli]
MVEITRRAALAAAAGLALPWVAAPAHAQTTRIRFAHPHPESDSWHRAALLFAKTLKERSDGAIQVQVFPNGALGSDPTIISAARGGTLDIALTGNPYFTGLAPKLNVLDLPFQFRDRKHVTAVLDGPMGDKLKPELEPAGLVVLGFWDIGFRNLTNSRRPVKAAADIEGLKIRTTPNPAHIKAFQLLGANPTPLAFTELFTALETRTVDGQENPTTLILNARFFEVQKHLSLTRHAYTAGILAMSKQRMDALPEKHRELIRAVAAEVTPKQRQMNEDAEPGSIAKLKEEGMQVVADPDRESMAKIVVEPVRAEYVQQFGPELPDAIQATGA